MVASSLASYHGAQKDILLLLFLLLFLLGLHVLLVHVFLTGAAIGVLVLNFDHEVPDLLVVSQDLLLPFQHFFGGRTHQQIECTLLHLNAGILYPCLEGDLEVHHCQERVNSILLLNDAIENIIVIEPLKPLVLDHEGLLVDLELGSKFKDLHLLVYFEVAILSPHAPVEQLVKINEPVVTLDSHFKKLLFELSVVIELL